MGRKAAKPADPKSTFGAGGATVTVRLHAEQCLQVPDA